METLTESSQDRSGFASPEVWSCRVILDPTQPARRRRNCCALVCALLALVGALLALACRAPITAPPPPRSGGPCADLAFAFFLVAEKRDHGSTRDEQIEALQAGVASPFAQRPEQTLEELLHVVDLVYRRPDASARELEALVRERCVVDERGQAVLRAAWPRRRVSIR